MLFWRLYSAVSNTPPHASSRRAGLLKMKNSGSPILSAASFSICACSSGGGSLCSPSRAAVSEVNYTAMV